MHLILCIFLLVIHWSSTGHATRWQLDFEQIPNDFSFSTQSLPCTPLSAFQENLQNDNFRYFIFKEPSTHSQSLSNGTARNSNFRWIHRNLLQSSRRNCTRSRVLHPSDKRLWSRAACSRFAFAADSPGRRGHECIGAQTRTFYFINCCAGTDIDGLVKRLMCR